VSVSGGTRVTVSGTAIPAGARVRVGLTASAVVSSSSTTGLVFTTPALVAGTYDVYVFDAAGSVSSVLRGGLTYLDAGGSAPTTAAPSSGAGSAPSSSAGSAPSSTAPSAATPTWVTGKHGQRLVRSALFSSLQPSIWKVSCPSACSGIAV